jgi:hypothetical protein
MTWRLPTPGTWVRLLLPLVLVGLPAAALLTPVADRIDTPLAADTRGWIPFPLTPHITPMAGGRSEATMGLEAWKPDLLLAQDEIALPFGTRGSHLRILVAEIRFGRSCSFGARPDTELADNALLRFERGDRCQGLSLPVPSPVWLRVVFEGAERLDLWTYVPPSGGEPSPTLLAGVPPPAPGYGRPIVRGRLARAGLSSARPRETLLKFVWQVAPSAKWIWFALGLAAAAMMAGAFLFPWGELPRVAGARTIARTAAGAWCLAAAIGLQYAVLVPPLQGPDETDHLLSYARVVGEPRLEREAAEWARRGHFQRIRFHSDEHFRPADIGSPYPEAWDRDVYAEQTELRSAPTTVLWRTAAAVLHGVRVMRVLLTIRVLDVFGFALAVALAAALFVWLGEGAFRQLAILPFALVPTLAFLASNMSEFSLLASAYVILSAAIVLVATDGPRAHLAGLPLGLGLVAAIVTGRSAMPMGVLVAGLLAVRAVLGARTAGGGARPGRAEWIFWMGFAAPVGSALLLALPTLEGNIGLIMKEASVKPSLASFGWSPAAVIGSGVAILACALTAFVVLVEARRALAGKGGRLVFAGGLAGAASIVAILGGSLAWRYPTLRVIEDRLGTVPWGQYVAEVLSVVVTIPRLGAPDHLLVRSFWAGFGWIDTLPPDLLTEALVVATCAAATVHLVRIAAERDGRRLLLLAALAVSLVLTAAVYAATSLLFSRNLHGRYLAGWYLAATGVAWYILAILPPASWRLAARLPGRVVLALCGCGLLHAYCLVFILQRYF